jgi:hypothetical protein
VQLHELLSYLKLGKDTGLVYLLGFTTAGGFNWWLQRQPFWSLIAGYQFGATFTMDALAAGTAVITGCAGAYAAILQVTGNLALLDEDHANAPYDWLFRPTRRFIHRVAGVMAVAIFFASEAIIALLVAAHLGFSPQVAQGLAVALAYLTAATIDFYARKAPKLYQDAQPVADSIPRTDIDLITGGIQQAVTSLAGVDSAVHAELSRLVLHADVDFTSLRTALSPLATVIARLKTLQQPVVTRLDVVSGPAAGGTLVVVTGDGLSGATEVLFGDVPAVRFDIVSDREVHAVAPGGDIGTVDVAVRTPAGLSLDTRQDHFAYV